MTADHECSPPPAPGAGRVWDCPRCGRRHVWAVRHIGGRRYEQWWVGPVTFDDRRRRSEIEWRRGVRRMVPVGIGCALAMLALVVWIVLRVTS